jgi:glutathione S-transferase
MVGLILYELEGLGGRRYSQFSWRTKLALAHKGLEAEVRPVRISDKESISFSGQDKVPILVDDGTVIADSWKIAEHLESKYPDAPSLFRGEIGYSYGRFVNTYVDRCLIPKIVPLLMIDVVGLLDDTDARHLRRQIETMFKNSLEGLSSNRERDIVGFRRLLDPARITIRSQPFLSGSSAAYPDYVLFSLFQWARIGSSLALVEATDVLAQWHDRMLDQFGGLARSAPAFHPQPS